VTCHQTDYSAAITASAHSFLADVKREMSYYAPDELLNTDQIGLEPIILGVINTINVEHLFIRKEDFQSVFFSEICSNPI
jgi:hypothetical protein